jgi:signal transduction histidine kinase
VSFKGLTELLTKNYDDFTGEERLKFINSMKSSAKHLYNLFENLLDWSRIQTNRTKFSPAPFNVNPIIEQVVTLMELSAQSKKIKVKNNLPKKDIEAFGDKQMFATILRNLFTNSIKFTPENGEITISTKPGKGYVELSVKDNGTGIPNEDQDKLFRIDEHISKPGTKEEKGTGLGLILCKELVEKNNGKIWLESEEGIGSIFYFTFPNKEIQNK